MVTGEDNRFPISKVSLIDYPIYYVHLNGNKHMTNRNSSSIGTQPNRYAII